MAEKQKFKVGDEVMVTGKVSYILSGTAMIDFPTACKVKNRAAVNVAVEFDVDDLIPAWPFRYGARVLCGDTENEMELGTFYAHVPGYPLPYVCKQDNHKKSYFWKFCRLAEPEPDNQQEIQKILNEISDLNKRNAAEITEIFDRAVKVMKGKDG